MNLLNRKEVFFAFKNLEACPLSVGETAGGLGFVVAPNPTAGEVEIRLEDRESRGEMV